MQPNGLLLLLEEPYLGPSTSGENIRGMVLADALRHKLKVAQRFYQIRAYLVARNELPVSKRAREPSPDHDEDAMVVDEATPVHSPLKRRRFEAPRAMGDRPFRRLVACMRVRVDSETGIRVALHDDSGGTIQVKLKSARPVQPAIRPRWRPDDTRPKFSVASLDPTDKDIVSLLSYHYALHLRLRPREDEPRHAGLLDHENVDDVYKTPLDTADCIYWFVEDDFALVIPDPDPPLESPPAEIASGESSPRSTAGDYDSASSESDESSEEGLGGESYDVARFSVDSHVGLSGASYEISLSVDAEIGGPLSSRSSLDGANLGMLPIGESARASSSGVASRMLQAADTTQSLNVTYAVLSGNATLAEHVQVRGHIRLDPSSGASRIAVAPSDVAVTEPRKGEASKSSEAEGAERPQTVECQTSPESPSEGASSATAHLAQEKMEAAITGVHSLSGAGKAEVRTSTEGVLEPTVSSSEHRTEGVSQRQLSQSPAPFMMTDLRTLPPGAAEDMKDTQQVRYGDNGNVHIRRWSIQDASAPFEFPSWCWNRNAESATFIELPRILAHRVNRKIVEQRWDGNFGLGIPGWRDPWTNSDDTRPEDQVTFYDVLQHNDNARVDKPWIMTLRLLWPQDQARSSEKGKGRASDDRVRSFVYFGDGEPCAVLGPADVEPIAPQWGPRIFVWPQSPANEIYTSWQLRLLSMTLLKPQHDDPDYADDSQWEAIEIEMPATSSRYDGVEVTLDTCASRSYFPAEVINNIVQLWLKDPKVNKYKDAKKTIFVTQPEDYESFDIVFKFLGSDHEVVNFRCGARDFLVSPYRTDDCGYFCPLAGLESINSLLTPHESCILGTNFFWCAMTRLVAPLHDGTKGGWDLSRAERPYVQLAPQRIVLDGRKVAGPRDIKIYEEHPPWFQPGKHEPMAP